MHRRLPLMMALAALPLAIVAGMGNGGVAAADAALPTGTPMALDGHLLVESMNHGGTDRRMVREAADARSGDRLIFLIRYRNRSSTKLPGYDFVAPVPDGVRILPDRRDSVRVSADGGHSWSRPDSPLRTDVDGKLRPADGVKLTHVRLRLDHPVAPGESGTVAWRGLLL